MNDLWRDHPATHRQQSLFVKSTGKHRAGLTQADVLIGMRREPGTEGRSWELPEIMQAGIAQDGARFNEIRALGFLVANETARSTGIIRFLNRLTFAPESESR